MGRECETYHSTACGCRENERSKSEFLSSDSGLSQEKAQASPSSKRGQQTILLKSGTATNPDMQKLFINCHKNFMQLVIMP